MASVPEECLVMVAPQEQELLSQGAAPEALTTILIVAGSDAGGGGGGGEEVGDEAEVLSTERALGVTPKGVEDGDEVSLLTEVSPDKTAPRYTKQPAQVSLPPEMASKLGRQDSSDSVGSMEEEGIQADAAPPDGQDAPSERTDEEGGPELEPRSERSSSVVSDASEEGARDSGIEAEREPDMVLPDEDLMARIVAQVEYYFSDSNVAKDKFLLKHIRRNKEGYVSLKLVSSFKKVKQLTKDWRVVAHSLTKCSDRIQMNDAGTKIRRVAPLPDLEEVPVTCAVLVTGLPLEKPSVQSVSQLFSACGDIAFIRVLRAGGALPQDLKALAAKHPALGDSSCAWVEFEAPEGAKAAAEMSNEDGMKVLPILPEAEKKQKQQEKAQQKGSQPNSRKNSVAGCGGGCGGHQQPQQKGPASRKNSFAKIRKDSTAGGSTTGSEGEAPQFQRFPRRKCLSLPQTQSPNLKELSAVVEARRNRPKSKSCTEFQLGGVGSPSAPPSSSSSWVQRHLLAAAAASAASAASPVVGSRPPVLCRPTRISQGSLPLPDGVVRFPKGPDGSKGFNAEARRRTTSSPAETTVGAAAGATTTTTTNTTTSSSSSPSASPAGDGTPTSS